MLRGGVGPQVQTAIFFLDTGIFLGAGYCNFKEFFFFFFFFFSSSNFFLASLSLGAVNHLFGSGFRPISEMA
jgi:hypothetical protein